MTAAGGGSRLMVVVAHPDDETFGCGSLLLHAAAHGIVTSVVCATRGEAGERADGVAADREDLGAVREGELRAAAEALRVMRVELLDFRDSGMNGPAGAEALVNAPLGAVRDQVLELIEQMRPHVVVTLDGGDGHRDHVRVREATLAAVDSAQWGVDRVYLQCLPKSLIRRWTEHMARHDASWEHLTGEVPGTADERITTVIDTGNFLAARLRAIAMHRSQRSPYDGLPDDLGRQFLTTEYLRQVRPQPADGTNSRRESFSGPRADGARPIGQCLVKSDLKRAFDVR